MGFEYCTYKHFIDSSENQTWDCEDDGLCEELGRLGQQGWELVSTEAAEVRDGEIKILLCVLKRPLE